MCTCSTEVMFILSGLHLGGGGGIRPPPPLENSVPLLGNFNPSKMNTAHCMRALPPLGRFFYPDFVCTGA